MKPLIGILFILILTGCFKKSPTPSQNNSAPSSALVAPAGIMPENTTKTKSSVFTKEEREALYFAASLEREALKVLTKNSSFDEPTLFSVLSYAAEIESGVKKAKPRLLDCGLYRIEKDPGAPRLRRFFKTCQKPESSIAQLETGLNPTELKITFFIKEWAAVIGLPVTLTGENTICDLKLANKKLTEFRCNGWRRTLGTSTSSTQELRLQTFQFQRDHQNQMHLQGGVFKDLVENKKIEVRVPLEGKIKRIEKELEVIDQFADEVRKSEALAQPNLAEPALAQPEAPPLNPGRATRSSGRSAPQNLSPTPKSQGDLNESQDASQNENPGENQGISQGENADQNTSQNTNQIENEGENLSEESHVEGLSEGQNVNQGSEAGENQQPQQRGKRAPRGR